MFKAQKDKLLRDENIKKELDHLHKYANCINCPSNWFFPPNKKGGISVAPGSDLFNAFSICNECSVKQECFNFARNHECVGVWGGKLFTFNGISRAKIKE